MERRAVLAVLGAAAAGCTGRQFGATPTATPTPAPRPRISDAGIASQWAEPGDLRTYRQTTLAPGTRYVWVIQASVPVHDGVARGRYQITLPAGDIWGNTFEILDRGSRVPLTFSTPFYTDELAPGEYEATALVRDSVAATSSEPYRIPFSVKG